MKLLSYEYSSVKKYCYFSFICSLQDLYLLINLKYIYERFNLRSTNLVFAVNESAL